LGVGDSRRGLLLKPDNQGGMKHPRNQ